MSVVKEKPDAPESAAEPGPFAGRPAGAGGAGEEIIKTLPVAAAPAPAPRVVAQHERAPAGLRRFKVRAKAPEGDTPHKYVLAATREDAVAHYLDVMRLGRIKKKMDALAAKEGDPDLALQTVVTELPD